MILPVRHISEERGAVRISLNRGLASDAGCSD
jgi:hypothetical protein